MNLYVIRTTFQAYLAEKIISENNTTDNLIIFIAANNYKTQHYSAERLRKISKEIIFLVLRDTNKKISNFINHFKVLSILTSASQLNTQFTNVYVSSIDSVIVQTILSKVKFNKLYTFDDGTANYNLEGVYFKRKNSIILHSLAWLFGNKYDEELIKKKSIAHYAILASQKNIIENIIPINFDVNILLNRNNDNGICNVLLGGVFNSISTDPNSLITDIIEKLYFIDVYIPHPRETTFEIFSSKKNQDNSIAEIAIESLLRRYEKVNVYTFNSTTILTLSKFNRIKLYLISHKTIKNKNLFEYLSNFAEIYYL